MKKTRLSYGDLAIILLVTIVVLNTSTALITIFLLPKDTIGFVVALLPLAALPTLFFLEMVNSAWRTELLDLNDRVLKTDEEILSKLHILAVYENWKEDHDLTDLIKALEFQLKTEDNAATGG